MQPLFTFTFFLKRDPPTRFSIYIVYPIGKCYFQMHEMSKVTVLNAEKKPPINFLDFLEFRLTITDSVGVCLFGFFLF